MKEADHILSSAGALVRKEVVPPVEKQELRIHVLSDPEQRKGNLAVPSLMLLSNLQAPESPFLTHSHQPFLTNTFSFLPGVL